MHKEHGILSSLLFLEFCYKSCDQEAVGNKGNIMRVGCFFPHNITNSSHYIKFHPVKFSFQKMIVLMNRVLTLFYKLFFFKHSIGLESTETQANEHSKVSQEPVGKTFTVRNPIF